MQAENKATTLSRAEACSVLKEFYRAYSGASGWARQCAAIKIAIDVLEGAPEILEEDAE